MKKDNVFKFIGLLVASLPFITTIIGIAILPNNIPVHWGTNGIDKWGSKYQMLIVPCFVLIAIGMGKLVILLDEKQSIRKVLKIMNSSICMVFTVILMQWVYNAYSITVAKLPDIRWDKIFVIVIGIMMFMIGNYLPKVERNKIYGFRTSFSMKNDEAWNIAQRTFGASLVIGGCALIILNLVLYKYNVAFSIFVVLSSLLVGSGLARHQCRKV